MRKILNILLLTLTLSALLALCGYYVYQHFTDNISDVELSISRNNEKGFVDDIATRQVIMNICDTINNNQIYMIPIDSLREVLAANPWTTNVEASINLKGVLDVDIEECNPVMRVYNINNKSIYIDKDGGIYPENRNYTPHLLIASGHAKFPVDKLGNVNDSVYADTDLPELYEIMMSVLSDDYARNCVKQVYVDRNKNYIFSLNNTDIFVIFGDGNNADDKLFKMRHFLKKMLGNTEIDNYTSINLNFSNQVVCTKKK